MSRDRLARVRLTHYRSIRACDVHLGPLTFLVGPNGSGKSNFLDARRLVADGLTTSLVAAVASEQARRCGWFRMLERDLRRVLLHA